MDKSSLTTSLRNYHISVKEDWLNDAVLFCSQHGRANSPSDLLAAVIELFLHSDLTDSYSTPMKIPAAAVKMVLTKPMIFQIVAVANIARSVYEQFREVTQDSDDLSWFNGDEADTQDHHGHDASHSNPIHGRRLLKFKLFDGSNNIAGMEFGGLKGITEDVLPGAKIILTSRVSCRRGIMLLNDSNCQLLGGDVESLCKDFDRAASLAERIGIKMEKGKRKQVVLSNNCLTNIGTANGARSDGMATISPFLVRIPRDQSATQKVSDVDTSRADDVKSEIPMEDSFDVVPEGAGTKSCAQPVPHRQPDLPPLCRLRDINTNHALPSHSHTHHISHNVNNSSRAVPSVSSTNGRDLPQYAYSRQPLVQPSISTNTQKTALPEALVQREVLHPIKYDASNVDNHAISHREVQEEREQSIIPEYETEIVKMQHRGDLPIGLTHKKIVPHPRKQKSHERKGQNRSIAEFFRSKRLTRHAAVNKTVRSSDEDDRMVPATGQHLVPIPVVTLSQMNDSNDADVEISSTGLAEEAQSLGYLGQSRHNLAVEGERLRGQRQSPGPGMSSRTHPHPDRGTGIFSRNHSSGVAGTSGQCYGDNLYAADAEPRASTPRTSGRDHHQYDNGNVVEEIDVTLPQERGLTTPEMLSGGRGDEPRESLKESRQRVRRLSHTDTDSNNQKTPSPLSGEDSPLFPSSQGPVKTVSLCSAKRSRLDTKTEQQLNNTLDRRTEVLGNVFNAAALEAQTPAVRALEPAVQLTSIERFNRLEVVLLRDVLQSKIFWMLPRVVNVQAVCRVPNELKTKDGQWVLPMQVSDESVQNLCCHTSPVLLERLLGFTVASCQDPQVTRNIMEMKRRKHRAQMVAQSLHRLDLVLSIEMYPERNSTCLVVDVRTMADALQAGMGNV